jgi:hypothetical protein
MDEEHAESLTMTDFPLVYTILSLFALSFVEVPRVAVGLAGYIADFLADITVVKT